MKLFPGVLAEASAEYKGRVRVLPPDVAHRIAAGEVIERPASAVKELVENALAAGDTRAEVDIESGETALIRVCDDGSGMSPEDAGRAVGSHATSKISSAEDLARVLSLGFRGEALVWLRWDDKGLRRFLKVPYFRWFLGYFLTHHINRSLSALNRRLHAIAALANDPDTNKADRDTVKLYLQSLPPPPYKKLAFAVVIAAVLLAIPLRGFGNVLDVLPLVGALLRVDITYVARAFTGTEFDDTVRATVVLLLALSVVASLLTSPFRLKRLLFNLYPLTKERIASTAARDLAFSVEGIYVLEEQVFREVGLRRPKEGLWDLLFLTFVLVLLLLLSLFLGLVALSVAMSWDLILEVNTDAPGTVNVSLPEVHWIFYAVPAIICLIAFCGLLKRLIIAWRGRNGPASV